METTKLHNLPVKASRIGLGTWAIGGWMWGGTDERESIKTIHAALDKGVNLIDTAPVYGFGTSEKIVGKALAEYGKREDIVLVTKVALDWKEGKPFRNASKERIFKEIDDSLKRLQTDYIDVYMIHWPDPVTPFAETAEAMKQLMDKGKIKSIAVSNYATDQMDEFKKAAPLHVLEPPYNMFERGIEDKIMPYCDVNDIKILAYGALCRGLLSGKMQPGQTFYGDDLRNVDPKFQQDRFPMYLDAVDKLDKFARENYNKSVLHLAVRWMLDKGVDVALWGGRRPDQMDSIDDIMGWHIDESAMIEIDNIINSAITNPVGPEFMAPPSRKG
ncbi:MAG: aldo/keto reductase [Bacteroidales bacterium]|nr:aldo/keto reductase [Bacteroidales bacterium]